MQNAADLSAEAALKRFSSRTFVFPTWNLIFDVAQSTAEENSMRLNNTNVTRSNCGSLSSTNNRTLQNPVQIAPSDVEMGIYNFDTSTFTANSPSTDTRTPGTNAVRVSVRMGQGSNTPFVFRLARVLGFTDEQIWTRTAIAAAGARSYAIALDTSSSMDDATSSYPFLAPVPANQCAGIAADPDPNYNDPN